MGIALIVLVSLLLGAVGLAFYMDWLGLWVSEPERQEQIARSRERMQRPEEQSGERSPGTGV